MPVPISVMLKPASGACNLQCRYCFYSALQPYRDTFFKGFMQPQTAHRVIDAALAFAGDSDVFFTFQGGEPLLQPDIADFCAELKDMGFAVKLDTNGSFPATLEHLVERGLVDYVAMDMKAAVGIGEKARATGVAVDAAGVAATADVSRFSQVVGVNPLHAPSLMAAIGESVDFLLQGLVPYEFRTTVVRELHDEAHLRAIASDIQGARAWYLQGFVDSDGVIAGQGRFHAYSADEMHTLADDVRAIVPAVQVRGVD